MKERSSVCSFDSALNEGAKDNIPAGPKLLHESFNVWSPVNTSKEGAKNKASSDPILLFERFSDCNPVSVNKGFARYVIPTYSRQLNDKSKESSSVKVSRQGTKR